MKAFKSIVLLTAGVLAFSACDKRSDNQTSATGNQDTTMGAGASGTNLNAEQLPPASDVTTNQGAGFSENETESDDAAAAGAAGTGAAVGAGAASSGHAHDNASGDTQQGSGAGAVSDDAASEDLNAVEDDEAFSEETEIQEEESYQDSSSLGTGAGTSSANSEYLDETSSEPDDVRGGRDARLVPRNQEIDNTSSEPDQQDL